MYVKFTQTRHSVNAGPPPLIHTFKIWKALKTKFFHESFGCNPDWQMRGFSVLLQKVTPLKMGCSPSASLTCYVIYGMCTVSSFYFCVFLKYSYFYKYFLLFLPCHLSCQILVPWPGIKPWPPEAWSQQEYWSWLPFPPPEDLSHAGIKPRSPACRQILYRWVTGESPS